MRMARPARLGLLFALSVSSAVLADGEATQAQTGYVIDPLTGDYIERTVDAHEELTNEAEPDRPEPTPWEELVATVDLIRNDAAAARLAAADWWCDTFELLSYPDDENAEEAGELLQFLLSFARTSSDDWLVDRLAMSMAECSVQRWSPLFLDLLNHPSTQLRWRAVQHYSDVGDRNALPALEAFWNEDLPPWVRADLADALLENGSSEHVEDCVDLVEADDIDLARAALRTLGETRSNGALEALQRHAGRDDSRLREEAVEALAAWPDDSEVMRLLVDLSRSGPSSIRDTATSALWSFKQPAALGRLVEVALDTAADIHQRLSATNAVAASDHPDLIRVLRRVLDEPDDDATIMLKHLAHGRLSSLGVETPLLEPLPIEYSVSFTITCSVGVTSAWRILAPSGEDSVRCWAAPHIAGDPEEYERLAAGIPVRIDDHFRSGEEHWVQVQGETCWVRIEELGEPTQSWDATADRPFDQEFDVLLTELDSPMGEALVAADMIRIFDITETVAAIAFEIDSDDREQVERLVDLYVDDESMMSYFLWDALVELEDRYTKDEELSKKIADALDGE
jgi:HEAT repeat protein